MDAEQKREELRCAYFNGAENLHANVMNVECRIINIMDLEKNIIYLVN